MTENQIIDRVKELTELLTPISDMAVLLNVPESELRIALLDPENPISHTYREVKAQVALDIRRRDLELAAAGSPTAAEAVNGYFKKMLQDE